MLTLATSLTLHQATRSARCQYILLLSMLFSISQPRQAPRPAPFLATNQATCLALRQATCPATCQEPRSATFQAQYHKPHPVICQVPPLVLVLNLSAPGFLSHGTAHLQCTSVSSSPSHRSVLFCSVLFCGLGVSFAGDDTCFGLGS